MEVNNNENKVTLLGYYGSDKTHCLSAWQSTNIELGIELPEEVEARIPILYAETVKGKKKSAEDLLKMLADHNHLTPFEKSTLHFQVTADIATHIHCLKHRIGVSINSESARYKELEDKWYLPKDWDDENVKFTWGYGGTNISFNAIEGDNWCNIMDEYVFLGHYLYHSSIKDLEEELGRKRAKESARFFLPYAKQLDYDMMFNFRSFAHFVGLRGSNAAQKEVQCVAHEMVRLVKEIPGNPFESTLKAFGM